MQQKKKVSYSMLVVLFMLILFGVITAFSSFSPKAEDYYTGSTQSYYVSSYYTSSYYASSYAPYSSYTPYSSYEDYSSYNPYYDTSSYYYGGTSSYYSNSYSNGNYLDNYSSNTGTYSQYSSSKGAAGAISLLPDNSSKDRGTTDSQNWNDLLKLVPSDVSSGVFTFDSSAATSAGGDWMTWSGFVCIALGVLGVFLVIFFQFLSPKSPRKMKKLYIAKAIEYSNNYAKKTSQSAKSVARDYRNIYSTSKNSSGTGHNANYRPSGSKNTNYRDPYQNRSSSRRVDAQSHTQRRSNRYK